MEDANELSRTELDSHANMPVIGRNAYILGHVPTVILVCIVEMHTLNLLTCGYHLGTTLNYSVFQEAKYPQQVMHTDFVLSGEEKLLWKKVHTFVGGSNMS